MMKNLIWALLLPVIIGCTPASTHLNEVRSNNKDNLTVGKVQREIKVGMPTAEVVEVLGSPNIVTTDSERREVWIYDKISTETVYSSSSGGVSSLILGWGGSVAGGVAPNVSQSAGAKSTSQRTLTIILKFDSDSKLRDFAYHASSF